MSSIKLDKLGFSESEFEAASAFFNSFDTQGNGKISLRDLRQNMINSGYDLKSDVIFEMLNHINREGLSDVTFEEFISFMATKPRGEENVEEIQKIFELFDEEGNGYISSKQLGRVCRELGYNFTPQEIIDLVKTCSPKEDSKITFDDFYTIMTKSSFP